MSQELRPGQQLDAYTIGAPLGRGGMAAVYQATHLILERSVAVKVINPALNVDPTFPLRFLREAKTLVKLNHPNIVTVYDFNNRGEVAYLVMELAPGGTLRERAENFRTLAEAVKALAPVCDALQFAHNRGIVHRDVKPNNVLINERGDPVLADFGLARVVAESLDYTLVGTTAGSPNYMAPEQVKGEDLDHRVDIYALGIVAYEVITGRLPYTGKSALAVMQQHLSADPPSIQSLLPDAPARLDSMIRLATAKRPEDRFASAKEFLEELQASAAEALELPIRAGRTDTGRAAAARASLEASAGAPRTTPAAPDAGRKPHDPTAPPSEESAAMEESEAPDEMLLDATVVFPVLSEEREFSDATMVAPHSNAEPALPVEPAKPSAERPSVESLGPRPTQRPSSLTIAHRVTIGLVLVILLVMIAASVTSVGPIGNWLFHHLSAIREVLAGVAVAAGLLNAGLMRAAVLEDRHLSPKTYQRLRENHRFIGYTTILLAISVQLLTWIQIRGVGMAPVLVMLNLVFGSALLLLAVSKVVVVRYVPRLRRYLPLFGIGLAGLLLVVLAINTIPLLGGIS